jgi:predicted dehydrogenase
MVAHVLRFWPEYRVVQQLVAGKSLGAPRSATAWRLNPPCTHRPWFYVPGQSGGAVIDLLIHDLDIFAWLFGALDRVQAQGRTDEQGSWQHVQALLHYESDVLATAEASFLMAVGYPSTFLLRVDLEDGTIEYNNRAAPGPTLTVLRTGRPPEHPALPVEDGIVAEIAYFLQCVREGRAPEIITPRAALDSLADSLRVKQVLDSSV